MKLKSITLLGLWLGLIHVSLSTRAQTVDSFIQMAIENNPGLESLRLKYQAAQFKSKQVADYPDPKVNIALGVLPIETRLGAQRFKMGINQELPWKGLLNAKAEVAASKAETMAYMDQSQAIDIAYNIRAAYATLLYINQRMKTIENRLAVLDAMEEMAKSAIRSGKGKLSNILLLERSRLGLENDLGILVQQKEGPTITINRWTGRPLDEPINVIRNTPISNNTDELLKYATTLHPMIQTLENQVDASIKESELTQLEAKPKLNVGIEYAWISQRDGIDIANNGRDAIMPMAGITIPFHTGRYDAKRQEEKVNQESIHAQLKDVKLSYQTDIAQAYAQIESAELSIKKMNELYKITTETIQLMRIEYASEGTRFEELLRLELDLIDYDLSIVQAHYQRDLAQATLLKYQK